MTTMTTLALDETQPFSVELDKPRLRLGRVGGRVEITDAVAEEARVIASQWFESASAQEFSGHAVEVLHIPEWVPALEDWAPIEELQAAGYKLNPCAAPYLSVTACVDRHVDDEPALSFGVVITLFADGHRFKTAGAATTLTPGEWLIFDFRKPHEVTGTTKSTSHVAVVLPLLQL